MKRIFALALVLALLALTGTAYADMKRGDKGEDVTALQQLLIEAGWLIGQADGSFGPKTETAVRSYQAYKEIEVTGVADDSLIDLLRQDIAIARGELSETVEKDYPPFCRAVYDDSGYDLQLCEEHDALREYSEQLEAVGTNASLTRASSLWKDEINRLMALWIQGAPAEDKFSAMAIGANWESQCEDYREVLKQLFPGDNIAVEREMISYLKATTYRLCELLESY
ncbi:MAG: peptidoglycan-binding protein [Clostridia bacterium]|nr:peptidoglycan-binding protein [Clostridia bacterium]